jgi:hypothetical protein
MKFAEPDCWRVANLRLKRHDGPDAAIAAAQRADECLAAGDIEGQAIWKRIVEASAREMSHRTIWALHDPDQSSAPLC